MASEGAINFTRIARAGAAELGISEGGMIDVVMSLTRQDFTHSNSDDTFPGKWQDVYKPAYEDLNLYIKLRVENYDKSKAEEDRSLEAEVTNAVGARPYVRVISFKLQ